jgi:hypothetical protein
MRIVEARPGETEEPSEAPPGSVGEDALDPVDVEPEPQRSWLARFFSP